jgi:hypothetical protein
MATYRVYFVDRRGHISRPARILEATDDQQARELATPFIDELDVEVWHEARFVAKYTPSGRSRPISGLARA